MTNPLLDNQSIPSEPLRSDELSWTIRRLLADFLGFESAEEVLVEDRFSDLGTDSHQAVVFKLILEKNFLVQLRTSVLFEYPTVESLVNLIADLTRESNNELVHDLPEVESRVDDFYIESSNYPLSCTQTGLWYISEAMDHAKSYHVPILFRLKNRLNVDRWNSAMRSVFSKHPALRVQIRQEESTGVVRQFVMPVELAPKAYRIDIDDSTPLDKRLRQEVDARFDLTQGFPLRCCYGHHCDRDFVLLVFHHIVADGLSATLFVQELWQSYIDGADEAWPDNKLHQSIDSVSPHNDANHKGSDHGFWQFLKWEQDYLDSPQCEIDKRFWSEKLRSGNGDAGLCKLNSQVNDRQVKCISRSLDREMSKSWADFCKSINTPPSVAFLALFYIILSKAGGRTDLTVSTPLSGRPGGPRGLFRDSVGCFINLILTRVEVAESATLTEWVSVVRQAFLEGIEHGHLPYAMQLKSAGRSVTDSDHNPYPISFTYQNIFESWYGEQPWGTDAEVDLSFYQEIEDELTLEVYEFEDTYTINWKYQKGVYASAAVESWADSFDSLLAQAIQSPSVHLSDLLYLAPPHAVSIQKQLDKRHLKNTSPTTVVDWIDQTADRFPSRIAIIDAGQQITYHELIAASRYYQSALTQAGVRTGDAIVLPALRQWTTIAKQLAILRTGSAFLPIDPDAPEQRSGQMKRIASAKELSLPPLPNDFHEIVDGNKVPRSPQSDFRVSGDVTAYVLFTSGSTGAPKGVPIRHESLVNLCHAMIDLYQLAPEDRILQFASLTFDMSIEEIFPALCAGSSIVLRSSDDLEPHRLLQLTVQSGVTIANLPPSYHDILVKSDIAERFYSRLRLVAFGGDALKRDTLQQILTWGTPVLNVYGPTEATVNATAARYRPDCLTGEDDITIGSPLPGVAAYVTDAHGHVLPHYFIGDLTLAGIGLSSGYLIATTGTTRFYSSVLPADRLASRCYSTGDRAFVDHSGNIHLLGRNDDQISLRGHRIEPGEIEAALKLHSHVDNVLVIANRDVLCALIVTKLTQLEEKELREFLSVRLPRIMIPESFIKVNKLPVSERGKLDRNAARKIADEYLRNVSTSHASDLISTEDLAAIPFWSIVSETIISQIGARKVRPTDNFFEMGGDSLTAIIVVGRLNQALNRDLSLRDFLLSKSIREVCERVDDSPCREHSLGIGVATSSRAPAVNRGVLSPSQKRLWFLDRMNQGAAYVVPAMAQVMGILDGDLLKAALTAIAERHESLRTHFLFDCSKPGHEVVSQVVRSDFQLDYQEAYLSSHPEAMAWISQEASIPFSLTDDALWKVRLVRYAPESSILLISMHHIITDGWSMRILIDELKHFFHYRTLIDLSPLPIQYADYARETAQQSISSHAISFWTAHLRDLDTCDLETDHQPPRVWGTSGETISERIPQHLSTLVSKLASRLSVTQNVVWLTALYLLLRKRGNGNDIVLGIPVAGRDDPRLEGLIGFFVNTLAFRVNGNNIDFSTVSGEEFVRHNFATMADCLQYQSTPIEVVLDLIKLERRTDRSPLFQVLFNYASNVPKHISLGDALLTPILPENKTAKFELTFSVNESSENQEGLVAVEFATDLYHRSTVCEMIRQWFVIVDQLVSQPNAPLSSYSLLGNDRSMVERSDLATKHRKAVQTDDSQPPLKFEEVDFAKEFFQSRKRVAGKRDKLALEIGEHAFSFDELEKAVCELTIERKASRNIFVEPIRRVDSYLGIISGLVSKKPVVFSGELENCELPADTAILLPTSGSTGSAKLVAVRGTSLANHAKHFCETFCLTENDRVASYASLTFDLLLEEIIPELSVGASVHVVPDEVRLSPQSLSSWVVSRQISVLDLPTSVFHLLVSYPQACNELSRTVRLVIVGGERLDLASAQEFSRLNPTIQLWNTYGPTEATIICTAHKFDPNLDLRDIPLGSSFGGARLDVVDPDGKILPDGTRGELVISGPGVALGYFEIGYLGNSAIVSGDRFLACRTDRSVVRYLTGDRVHKDGAGILHFHGRMDDQVKIRGHRVDPQEVATAIKSHVAVEAAVVVVKRDRSESPSLIAAVKIQPEAEVDPEKCRTHFQNITRQISASLPDSMRPSKWLNVAEIPLSPRGKVDRQAILRLAESDPANSSNGKSTEPTTATLTGLEKEVYQTWQRVLRHSDFGIHDSFFMVGGHSLLAVKLVHCLNERFDCRLSVSDAFSSSTVSQQAELVLKNSRGPKQHSTMRFLKCHRESINAIVVLPGLPGLGDLYYPLAETLQPRFNVVLASLPGLNDGLVAQSIQEIAERWASDLLSCSLTNRIERIILVAHSYSGSVLLKMIDDFKEKLPMIDKSILIDCWPHVESTSIDTVKQSWLNQFDFDSIPKSLAVTRAALLSPGMHLKHPLMGSLHFLIAEGSRALLSVDLWKPFAEFRSVLTIPGDHLSVMRPPESDAWTQTLNFSDETVN